MEIEIQSRTVEQYDRKLVTLTVQASIILAEGEDFSHVAKVELVATDKAGKVTSRAGVQILDIKPALRAIDLMTHDA